MMTGTAEQDHGDNGRPLLPVLLDIARPRIHKYSIWNFGAILCTSCDIGISSFEAAILDFLLPAYSTLVIYQFHLVAGPQKH